MAFNIVTNTYSGEASVEFYSAALAQSGTIKGGHVTIIPNVKSKIALRKADVGAILQADGCDFTASGDIVIDERMLEVTPMKLNMEVCVPDLEATWSSRMMSAGSDAGIPASENAMFLDLMGKSVGNQLERLFWAGDIAGAAPINLMDGLLKIAGADVATAKVPAPIAITPANVLAELARGYDLIPEGILYSSDLRLYVSTAVFRAYTEAMNAIGGSDVYNIQKGFTQVFYRGIEVLPAQGMGTGVSRYMYAEKTNITFGTDLVNDIEDIKVLDMNNITGANTVRFVSRMKAGVNYGVSSEIVIY